jgi:hypothetical protein
MPAPFDFIGLKNINPTYDAKINKIQSITMCFITSDIICGKQNIVEFLDGKKYYLNERYVDMNAVFNRISRAYKGAPPLRTTHRLPVILAATCDIATKNYTQASRHLSGCVRRLAFF